MRNFLSPFTLQRSIAWWLTRSLFVYAWIWIVFPIIFPIFIRKGCIKGPNSNGNDWDNRNGTCVHNAVLNNVTPFQKSFLKLVERTNDWSLNAFLDPLWGLLRTSTALERSRLQFETNLVIILPPFLHTSSNAQKFQPELVHLSLNFRSPWAIDYTRFIRKRQIVMHL